jgi:DNA-directed RNA polymerase III subunit RPC1
MPAQKGGPFVPADANKDGPRPPPKPDFSPVIPQVGDKARVIGGIHFGMMPGHEMMRLANVPICSRDLYRLPSRQPAPYGVLDQRLGISDKAAACGTCGLRLADCAGHWGVVQLELPVYHIGFLKATIAVLQSVCKCCSRVLLSHEDRKGYNRIMRDPETDPLKKARIRRKIQDMVKKVATCPYCGGINGVVKKVNGECRLLMFCVCLPRPSSS